jgi:putative endopeptidase
MVNIKPASLARQVMIDVHAPAQFRVNGPVSNLTEFYKTFGIKKGDPMFREDSLRVKIW